MTKTLYQNLLEKVVREPYRFVQKTNIEKTLFFSILLFLPTQLGKHFWPPFSFVLGQRIDYLSPTLYVTDVLMVLLFFCWLLSKKKHMSFFTPTFFVMSIFFMGLLWGISMSPAPLAGIYGIIKLVEYLFFGMYTRQFFQKHSYQFLFLPFSCALIGESILTISQYLYQGSIGGILYFVGERLLFPDTPGAAVASLAGQLVLRPYGTFSHPNVLAAYLLIGMVLVSTLTGEDYGKKQKILSYMVVGLSSIALFVTFSRVAVLLWVVLCAWFFLSVAYKNIHTKRRFSSIFLPSLTVFLLGILFFFIQVHARFMINGSDTAVTSRLALTTEALSLIYQHPLFGVGLNEYWYALGKMSVQHFHYYQFQPVHNIYLFILAEVGVWGFTAFCVCMIKTYRLLWRAVWQKIAIRKQTSRVLFVVITIILILGFFDHYFLTLQQGQLLFSFVLGLCWAWAPSKKNDVVVVQ